MVFHTLFLYSTKTLKTEALKLMLSHSENTLPFGDTIVVANPGTGKTWELVERVMKLLRNGINGEDIVCVTFTNKAADEMKSRIFKAASSEPELFDQALKIEVSTIHGYAMNYLQGTGVETEIVSNTVLRYIVFSKLKELNTFDYGQGYLMNQIVPKIENGIRYLKSFGIVPTDIKKDELSEMVRHNVGNTKSAHLTSKAIDVLVRDFVTIFQAYEDFKADENSLDFNDLLRLFLRNMDEKHRKIVLVDEFQDLNRMQVEIVGKLAETRFLVGDRKQSIFGFQGGSLGSFNNYLENSTFEKIGKNINHRSTNNILNYASSYYLAYSRDKYSRDEITGLKNPEKDDGDKVTLVNSNNPPSDAVAIVRNLIDLKAGGPKSIGVIARYNSQITKITSLLDSLNIGYSSTIRNKVDQSQIDEILAYISGLVSDDPAVVSKAILTPFAGLTLREAVEISKAIKQHGIQAEKLPANFSKLREMKFGLSMVEQAFNRIILPISASLGNGYLNSANLALDSAREYLSIFSEYSLEGYLDFMTLSSEQVESDLKESRINVLTVHKAKGLEFDAVVYVPSELPARLEYFDVLTSSIVLSSTGIDVRQDLLEEPLRVDFVAITRPREKLFIVADNKQMPRFQLQNSFYVEGSVDTEIEVSRGGKFDEAYMMFVNGRIEQSSELLTEQEKWLTRTIMDYFGSVKRLSYTLLDSIYNPYQFLKEYILGLKEASPYTQRGTNFHEIAHKFATGGITRDQVPDDVSSDFTNLEHAMEILKPQYSVPPKESELPMELPLSAVFPESGLPDDIIMKGKIDAIFSAIDKSGSFLIADYKTSKSVSAKHWQQLWLYTRMYQRKYGISPDRISGGVIYVGLRETINTGERGFDVQIRDYYKIKTDVVERRLREFLHYMDQPEAFIEKLLSKKPDTELDERLKEILEKTF